MLNHDELLKHPNYLLTTYNLEIYKQLAEYMKENKLKKKDVAKGLGFSQAYVSQIFAGKFNFTLKKIVELGLYVGKVPYLEYITPEEYWRRKKEGTKERTVKEYHYTVSAPVNNQKNNSIFDSWNGNLIDYDGGRLPQKVTTVTKLATPELNG